MKKTRSILGTLVMTLVLLLILEVFLRIFFPPKIDSTQQVAAFRHHPEYLVGLKPNMEKRFIRSQINGADTIFWQTNKDAFRGKELTQSGLRIMVYGDSNIQARFTDLSSTYPSQLEQLINENHPLNVEVINAGVVGFGPDQSLLKFKEEKEIYKPDIVILQVFADNDYGDIIRNKLFTVQSSGVLSRTNNKSALDPALQEYADRNKAFGYLRILDAVQKVRRSVKNEDEAIINAGRMMKLCSTLCREEYDSYIGKSKVIYSHFADHYDIDVAAQPNSDVSQKKIMLMNTILKEFKKEATESDIQLLVLIEPSAVDISRNSYMNYEDLQSNFPDYDPKNLVNFIASSCKEHNIPFINLFNTFALNKPEQLYFSTGNDHWTDSAQRLAAEITADQIIVHLTAKADSIPGLVNYEK